MHEKAACVYPSRSFFITVKLHVEGEYIYIKNSNFLNRHLLVFHFDLLD